MSFESNDNLRILNTLKKWGVLDEKRISDLAKMSHRRCSVTLSRLEQSRYVKLVENRQFGKSYRITGSGLDQLDKTNLRRVEERMTGR